MFTHLRRGRGYSFETRVVAELNSHEWRARRLGGSSMGLPDVVAVSTYNDTLYSIECKSTKSTAAYVPQDQLLRCKEITQMFDKYTNRYVVLGFKFAANKAEIRNKRKIKKRKLKYFFFIISDTRYFDEIEWFKCDDTGRISFKSKTMPNEILQKYQLFDKIMLDISLLRTRMNQRTLV